jgi:ribosomal protein S18 acetylase RimI-like enzyme
MGVVIRNAMAEDRTPIEEVLRRSAAFNGEEVRVALEMFDERDAGGYSVRVTEIAGSVCGYVCFGQAPLTNSSWYIYWICVHPDAQRRGVGRALHAAAEAVIRARGGERLVLETSGRPDYDAARRFYAQVGYIKAGWIADFYRAGDDCIIYVKQLS